MKQSRIVLMLVFALLMTSISYAQSERPVPSGGQFTGRDQNHSASAKTIYDEHQNGTQNNPFIIEDSKAEHNYWRTYSETKDANDNAASNRGFWVAVVVAMFACLQWLVYCCQSRLMRISINENRKANIAQLRAYVMVKNTFSGLIVENGRPVAIQVGVKWENSGATPTKDMIIHDSYKAFPGDIPDDFTFPDLDARKPMPLFVAPRTWVGGRMHIIPMDDLIRAYKEQLRLYVWGWADYRDQFPNTYPHRTEFCHEIKVIADPATIPGNLVTGERYFSISQYRIHNAADQDCKRKAYSVSPIS